MLRHATRLAVLMFAAVCSSSAMAASKASLNDSKLGSSQAELHAQIVHSTDVIEFFTVGHGKWMPASRHSSCAAVAWRKSCVRARATLAAHRWLLATAQRRDFESLPSGGDMPNWACLHRHEGSWTDTRGTYQGGLQMDAGFAHTYGPDFQRRYGASPGSWPIWAQITAARRARDGYGGHGGRGYGPWPTRRYCGI